MIRNAVKKADRHVLMREIFDNYGEITWDVAIDDPEELKKYFKKVWKNYLLKADVTRTHGMGAGWPEVKFTGTWSMIAEFSEDEFDFVPSDTLGYYVRYR